MPDRDNIATLAIALISKFEGCRLHAYPDPASGGEPITIGWGCAVGVKLGDVWTQAQADDDLRHRVIDLTDRVCQLVDVPTPDASCAALVSFAYNCGIHALSESTLLRKVNTRKVLAAADEFLKWTHAAGKVNPGLVKRRTEERAAFLAGLAASGYPVPPAFP